MEIRNIIILIWIGFFSLNPAFSSEKWRTDSWKQVKNDRKGTITVLWQGLKPYIYKLPNGQPAGIEYELGIGFSKYLKQYYSIDLEMDWVEMKEFTGVYQQVQTTTKPGLLGCSSFSVLPSRQKQVNFTPAYMSDVSFLVSSFNVPIVFDTLGFKEHFKGLTGIAVANSLGEKLIRRLQRKYFGEEKMKLVEDGDQIVHLIGSEPNHFGYVDLPNYLLGLETGMPLKRQNVFLSKKEGLAFIYPKNSDWQAPLDEYFKSDFADLLIKKALHKYLGADYVAMERNNPFSKGLEDEMAFLIREKEIQNQTLIESALDLEQQMNLKNYFVAGFVFILVIALFTYKQYRMKRRANKLLELKTNHIKNQAKWITLQKDELENKNKMLLDMDEEKNHLIEILAHDIRTPLNQIKGFAQIIKLSNNDPDHDTSKNLDNIIGASDRLTHMTESILDVNTINTRSQLNLEKTDLAEILDKTVKNFKNAADQKKLKIQTDFKKGEYFAQADPGYLLQIFDNLLSNAIKFVPPNRRIELKLSKSDGLVITEVRDDGPGIPKEEFPKLFKKYQKLSTKPTAGESSMGLGLSLVKKYVEAMNGKVWCESRPGKGTNFLVSFNQA